MPARKSRKSPSRSTASRKSTAVSTDISYETKLTIVILLLLFVYPLGLIFMWAWMRTWPTWLKVIISIPLAFALLAFFAGVFFIVLLIRHAATNSDFQNRMRLYQQMRNEVFVTPSPMQADTTATPTSSVSY